MSSVLTQKAEPRYTVRVESSRALDRRDCFGPAFLLRRALLCGLTLAINSIYVSRRVVLTPESPVMLPPVPTKPKIAIVGAGRLGSALARELFRARYTASEIIGREKSSAQSEMRALAASVSAQASTIKGARFDADVIWICVPDRKIAQVAREMAARIPSAMQKESGRKRWRGKVVIHSSGALTSDELDILRARGADVASVHPLMTFVPDSVPSLKGVPFGIEGDRRAVGTVKRILQRLGAQAFMVRKENKAAYHAWATLLSPLFLAFLTSTEMVAQRAGLSARQARTRMLPIMRQSLANYVALGPGNAFSGPVVRGDAETVNKHLQVLQTLPRARDVYVALAKAAVLHSPARNRRELTTLVSK
jgi:predicted short-subunit dehydrogenase-like oxidoreductase (DUF2520 family)